MPDNTQNHDKINIIIESLAGRFGLSFFSREIIISYNAKCFKMCLEFQ